MARVSFSQYSMFRNCPMQYKLTYIDKLGETSGNIHTVFGTGMHETIQEFLRVMYSKGKQEALNLDLNKYLVEQLKIAFRKDSEKLTEGYICTKAELDEFYDDGIQVLAWFKKNIDKLYSISGCELAGIEIELNAPIKNNVSFVGFIDVVIRDVNAKKIRLIDIKTSTRGWSDYQKKDKVKTSQLVLYKKYYSELFDVPIDNIEVEYQILRRKLPTRSPYPVPRFSKYSPANGKPTINSVTAEFESFVDYVFDENGEYRVDVPYDKNPGDKQKNCKFCEFLKRGLCDGKK